MRLGREQQAALPVAHALREQAAAAAATAAAQADALREQAAAAAAAAAVAAVAQAHALREQAAAAAAAAAAQADAHREQAAALRSELAAQADAFRALAARVEAAAAPAPRVAFRAVSAAMASRAAIALGIDTGGFLRADLAAYMPAAASLVAFDWGGVPSARAASEALLARLSAWAREGMAPPLANSFFDVQAFAADPIELDVDGAADFRGMVDAVVAKRRVCRMEELAPPTNSTFVNIDWTTPAAFANRAKVAAIARIQAFAFASCCPRARAQPPVIMTDLASGFRAWIVLDGLFYHLHPPERDFTLAEGVALVRLFAAQADAGRRACAVSDELAFVAGEPARGDGGGDSCDGSGGSGGSDGGSEDDSPEAVIQSIAVALSGGGGFRNPFLRGIIAETTRR